MINKADYEHKRTNQQDTGFPENKPGKKSTGTPLTDESFRRISQEMLKDFPSLKRKGACIRPVPKPWQSARVQLVSQMMNNSQTSGEQNKTQDTLTTMQGKTSINDSWTLEKARALARELLKDFPLGHKTGAVVIIPGPRRYSSAKTQPNTQDKKE